MSVGEGDFDPYCFLTLQKDWKDMVFNEFKCCHNGLSCKFNEIELIEICWHFYLCPKYTLNYVIFWIIYSISQFFPNSKPNLQFCFNGKRRSLFCLKREKYYSNSVTVCPFLLKFSNTCIDIFKDHPVYYHFMLPYCVFWIK